MSDKVVLDISYYMEFIEGDLPTVEYNSKPRPRLPKLATAIYAEPGILRPALIVLRQKPEIDCSLCCDMGPQIRSDKRELGLYLMCTCYVVVMRWMLIG